MNRIVTFNRGVHYFSLFFHAYLFVEYAKTLSYSVTQTFSIFCLDTPTDTITSEEKISFLALSHLLWVLLSFTPDIYTSSEIANILASQYSNEVNSSPLNSFT